MEDLKGDETYGCKTLPVILGIRKAKMVVYLLSATFLVTMFILTYLYADAELNWLTIGLILPLALLFGLLSRADTVRQFNQLSQFCKLIMLVGIFSMMIF